MKEYIDALLEVTKQLPDSKQLNDFRKAIST